MATFINEYEKIAGYFAMYCITTLTRWGICDLCSDIYNSIVPNTYFEFVDENGNVVDTQYNTCLQIDNAYSYVVYTNKLLKTIVSRIDAPDKLFYDKHKKDTARIISKDPFVPSLTVKYCNTKYVYYHLSYLYNYWKTPYSHMEFLVELKTSSYNYFICGNVLNKCILKYILNKHYPYVKLASEQFSIEVLTNTYTFKKYDSDFNIVLLEN